MTLNESESAADLAPDARLLEILALTKEEKAELIAMWKEYKKGLTTLVS